MNKLKWAALALLLAAVVSRAQDTPQADVAVEYSHLQVLKGYTISMNGGSAAVTYNVNDWLGVTADVGGYHGHPSESLTGETFTIGPRFTYRRFQRLQPFAQGLFGGSHFNVSSGGITGGGIQFAFAGSFGADIVIHREGKLAIRLQGDYFGTRSGGANTVSNRLSAGFVYRIGEK